MGFWEFPIFKSVFLIGSQKSKINKIPKNTNKSQQKKMQSKNKSNIMIQNKTREYAEQNKQKQNNILKQKNKQNKN